MRSRQAMSTAAALVALAGVAAGAASERFEADCRALTPGSHRLAGTPESRAAVKHILRRLEEIGIDRVIEQPFQTVQTRPTRCRMVVPGRPDALELLPLRPNGIVPPVTPEEGVTGEFIYAGKGEAREYTSSPKGKIVALDYNSGRAWMRAFAAGAKAVVFVSNGPDEAWQTLHTEAHANLLRFYYPGNREDLPPSGEVTIQSEVVWDGVTATNVYAFLEGTDPVFGLEKEELIIVATDLDSFGEVPRASPGARKAANCAALLAMIEHMKTNRPRRHVLFAFLDAEARGHAGSSALYRVLEDSTGEDVHLENRREYLGNEKKFLAALKDQLGLEKPWLADTDIDNKFVLRLKNRAEAHVDSYNDELELFRREQKLIDRDLNLIEKNIRPRIAELEASLPLTPEAQTADVREELDYLRKATALIEARKPRLEVVEAEMAKLKAVKKPWNNVRRGLVRKNEDGTMVADAEENRLAMENLARALEELGEDIELRSEELRAEERTLDADQVISDLIARFWISLHVSLAFGDTSPRWGLIVGGDSGLHSRLDDHGHYGKIQRTFLTAHESVAKDGAAGHFVASSADGSLSPPRVLWSAPFLVHSGEVSGRFGKYNVVLGTCQESLPREGTPSDTLDALDIGRIEEQASEAAVVLAKAAGEKGLSIRTAFGEEKHYFVPKFSTSNNISGPIVMARSRGGSVPNKPLPGMIVYFAYGTKGWPEFRPMKPYAFENYALAMTNRNGSYAFGPVPRHNWGFKRPGLAILFDERGMVSYASDLMSSPNVQQRLNAFKALHGAVVIPPQMETRAALVLGGRTRFGLPGEKAFQETFDGIVYWYCEERTAGIKLFHANAAIALLEEGDESEKDDLRAKVDAALSRSRRYGLPIEAQLDPVDIVEQSARDIWQLNNTRLKLLRTRGVLNKSLQELHARAEDLLSAAEGEDGKAVPEARRGALLASALLMEAPVYTRTRSTLDDLVHAVLVLLALSVPFGFALERLLIGATNIYRQISWFSCFFVLTFLVLYYTHPAFAISSTPMIIFLGFAVLVLSALVIVIIMQKFEHELKVMQGITSTVHAADVSRFNAIMAAMTMGVSTMRRRPLRTALTATTVILLTFTILCFASFGRQTGIVRYFLLPPPGYSGVQVHRVDWKTLNPDILAVLRGRWRDEKDLTISARYWVSPENKRAHGALVTREDGSRAVALRGILGLEASELAQRRDIADLLGATEVDDTVWVTEAVARRLEVKPGEKIIVGGVALTLGRYINTSTLAGIEDMDGSALLPVDFVEMQSTQQTVQTDESASLGRQNWSALPADSVAVVSTDIARRMGASLRVMTLYTKDMRAATAIGKDLVRILPIPVAATHSDGVYRQMLGSVMHTGGVRDLLFPIVLGGLVIFGTMLGSVADREKEIYTFSSLGLAPPHIASLFFAEAMVYSVIGGLGGYLLAEGSTKILGYLAEHAALRVPEMNHSSTNAIVTLLVVMATVLVSAIYPAMKASRSANPGILRTWRLPQPDGDTFDITFPFTVSEYDITGVVSFLKEHFDNFTDSSLGAFMSTGARIARGEGSSVGLDSELALAPFDLGVTEDFELRSAPSEIEGIDEVKIKITRKSGQPKDWQRLNKVLLDDLRRQFLIWRSLAHETMEIYRRRTLEAIAKTGAKAEAESKVTHA